MLLNLNLYSDYLHATYLISYKLHIKQEPCPGYQLLEF